MTPAESSPHPAAGREERTARVAEAFRGGLREIRCMGSERLLHHGVSMTHLHVMSMLEGHGELTMSELADTLGVSLSNTTGLVDRMVERGYVERVRVADDRRLVLVRICGEGRRVLAEVDVLKDELLHRVLDRLDDPALERVERALEDIRGAVVDVLASEGAFEWHHHLQDHAHGHAHPAAVPTDDTGPSPAGPGPAASPAH